MKIYNSIVISFDYMY